MLITAFGFHDKEKTLFRVLDDFADVYGDDIPGWLQNLYDYFGKYGNNGYKMDVVRKFAEQRKMGLNI